MHAQHQDRRHCFRIDKVLPFRNDCTEPRLHKLLYNESASKQGSRYRVTCDREFYETIISLKDALKFKLDNLYRGNIKAFGGVSKKAFDLRWRNHFYREVYELVERNNLLIDVAKIIRCPYPNYDERNRAFCCFLKRYEHGNFFTAGDDFARLVLRSTGLDLLFR